jgi:tetratricopeptide (TPR) repeat protein
MDSAEANFEKAFNTKPYMIEALQNLAKVQLVKGNFKEAARRFKQIMKVSPFDYNVQFLFERSLNNEPIQKPENRPRLTKSISEKVKPIYTYIFETNVASVINLINSAAMTLLRKGQLDDAIVMTRSFLDIYTASPELSYNLAHYYNIKNDLDKALEYAWRAVMLKEDFKDALDLVGNIFFKMSDYDNSIRAYSKVIAIDPKDAMSYYNLGCVFSAKGDLDSAEESWLNAIRYEQSKRIGNRNEASDDELSFSLVVVGRRVAFKSYMSLGHIYRDRKLWDKALENYQQALELEINNSELYYEIGKIYVRKGSMPEAKKYFDRYLYLGGEKEAEVKQLLETLKPKNPPE